MTGFAEMAQQESSWSGSGVLEKKTRNAKDKRMIRMPVVA